MWKDIMFGGFIMIDIDSRPDLRSIIMELNNYIYSYGKDNQINIAIPKFQNKANEFWYGLTLSCRPNRTDINTYICASLNDEQNISYLKNFETKDITLDKIINDSIQEAETCQICNKHYDIDKMEFFDNQDHGKGAESFFKTLRETGLQDVYLVNYDIEKYIKGEPLTTSHRFAVNNKSKRYDFIFINKDLVALQSDYLYDEAVRAGSDHAIICSEIDA